MVHLLLSLPTLTHSTAITNTHSITFSRKEARGEFHLPGVTSLPPFLFQPLTNISKIPTYCVPGTSKVPGITVVNKIAFYSWSFQRGRETINRSVNKISIAWNYGGDNMMVESNGSRLGFLDKVAGKASWGSDIQVKNWKMRSTSGKNAPSWGNYRHR